MDVSRRAYVYARYSSDNQREESIDAQVRACKYYAQHEDIEIVRIYADKEKSGLSVKGRTEYQRMMRDVGSGDVGIVLVHYLSRFGRNALELLQGKQALERLGIKFISVREKLDETPEGRLMLMILAGMNEFYSANLAVEVVKGMKENALKCMTTGGVPALGYNVGPDKKLVINEREAATVRLIFDLYSRGFGYGHIIDELNARGCLTKAGRPFGKNSLHDILRNERYNGIYNFSKISPRNTSRRRNSHRQNVDCIRIPDGCPRIVEEKTYERVQQMMDSNKHEQAKYKAKEIYLLSGKLFCGECGSRMVGDTRHANGVKYCYYSCNKRLRQKSCVKENVRKDDIESFVLSELNNLVCSRDNIEKIANRLLSAVSNPTSGISDIKKQISAVDAKINRLVNYISDTDIPDTSSFDAKIKTLQAEKASLLLDMEVSEKSDTPQLTYNQIVDCLTAMYDINSQPVEDQRALINLYVEKVVLYNDPQDPNGIDRHRCKIILNPAGIHVPTDYFPDSPCPAPPAPMYREIICLSEGFIVISCNLISHPK